MPEQPDPGMRSNVLAGLIVVVVGCVVAYVIAAARDSSPSRWRVPRGFFLFGEGWLPSPKEARRLAQRMAGAPTDQQGDSEDAP
jgi:uncharacterized protein YjeT (DUF2065 family)